MRVFQTRLESSNLSFRSNFARVAKWLRRRIANPINVSSSLTARSRSKNNPRHPRLKNEAGRAPASQGSVCGVAKLVRHRTVNAAMRRFESFRHSQSLDLELEGQSSGLLSREVRV